MSERAKSEEQSKSLCMNLRWARRQHRRETLINLVQNIRKLRKLSYPGKASDIVESIAYEAFIFHGFMEALSNQDLALHVLVNIPETLEKAYQTTTELHLCNDLINASKQHQPNVNV